LAEQVALVEDARTMYRDPVKDLWGAELWDSVLADWPGNGLPGVRLFADAYRWMFAERVSYALGFAI
jgi:hypothetical protein